MATFSDNLGVSAERQDRKPRPVISFPPDSFFISEVVDNVAHFGTMQVASAVDGVITGVPLLEGGIVGPRKIGVAYPVHTRVLCFKPPGATFCYVLGVAPEWVTSKEYNKVPSWIVPACSTGVGFDRAHRSVTERPTGPTGDVNFSNGSPCDELPGDYGHINEFGLSYGLGRFMAWLRASHFCGVEAFWIDNLLRLTGYNLEIQTAGSDLRAYDDEGEWIQIARWSPYPWETRGVLDHETDFTKNEGAAWNEPRSGREPVEDDQAGIWRVQEFKGYLGDLERTVVSLPLVRPEGSAEEGVERLSSQTVTPGVLDQGYSIDGSVRIHTAKGFLVEKTCAIPTPKEIAAPDDPTGDRPENYRAAGIYDSGQGSDSHTAPVVEQGETAGLRSLLSHERHALLQGYYQRIGFVRHENDWLLPEDRQSVEALGLERASYDPESAVSDTEFWMPLPKSVEVDVDHRGKSKYYSGRSFFEINDDGSIVLEDAYGSQIRMEGGNIFMSARNDVILQPGRSAQVWAPYDIVMKAGNSADLSASQGDVRIKAQGNLMAASVEKGVLIESQFDPAVHGDATPDWVPVGEAVESRGVLIKALNSDLVTMSQSTYIRGGALEGTEANSQVHIDAGAGDGELFLHGNSITQRAQTNSQVIIGSTGENLDTASLDITKNEMVLGGSRMTSMVFGSSAFKFGSQQAGQDASFTVVGDVFGRNMWANGTVAIDQTLFVNGAYVGQGPMTVDGAAVFRKPVIASGFAADQGAPFIGETSDAVRAATFAIAEHPEFAKVQIDNDSQVLSSRLTSERETDNQLVQALNEDLYGDDSRFASESLVEDARFSFRTPEEYNTAEGFVWYEARWQEMNRKLFNSNETWEENRITTARGEDTMPYPGFRLWESDKALVVLNDKLYNTQDGLALPRRGESGTIGEDAKLGDQERKTFREGYNVTLQRRTS